MSKKKCDATPLEDPKNGFVSDLQPDCSVFVRPPTINGLIRPLFLTVLLVLNLWSSSNRPCLLTRL